MLHRPLSPSFQRLSTLRPVLIRAGDDDSSIFTNTPSSSSLLLGNDQNSSLDGLKVLGVLFILLLMLLS
jgi:hypothetical protein